MKKDIKKSRRQEIKKTKKKRIQEIEKEIIKSRNQQVKKLSQASKKKYFTGEISRNKRKKSSQASKKNCFTGEIFKNERNKIRNLRIEQINKSRKSRGKNRSQEVNQAGEGEKKKFKILKKKSKNLRKI